MTSPDDRNPYAPGQPNAYTPNPAYPVPAQPQSPAGYPVPYSPGPYPPAVVAYAPPTSPWAIASLIFGIIGVAGGFCFFAIPCIVAVVCGHAGLRDTNGGVKSGRGMAQAGLIMGYLFVAPAIILWTTGTIGSIFQ